MYQLFGKVILKSFNQFDRESSHLAISKYYESHLVGFDPIKALKNEMSSNAKIQVGCTQLWQLVQDRFDGSDEKFLHWLLSTSEKENLYIYSDIENIVYLQTKLFKTLIPKLTYESFRFLIDIFIKKVKYIDANGGIHSSPRGPQFFEQISKEVKNFLDSGYIDLIWTYTFPWNIGDQLKNELKKRINFDLFFINYFTNQKYKPAELVLNQIYFELKESGLREFDEDVVLPLADSLYRLEKIEGRNAINWESDLKNQVLVEFPHIANLIFNRKTTSFDENAIGRTYDKYFGLFQTVFKARPVPIVTSEEIKERNQKRISSQLIKSMRTRENLNPYILWLISDGENRLKNLTFSIEELAIHD